MIPVNLHHCNSFFGNLSGKSSDNINRYNAFVKNLDVFKLECNFCHRHGECIRHGYYQRGYLLDGGEHGSGKRIRILRVRCKGCGHTHAILPEEIVPYLKFTIPFIYSVLCQYYEKKRTIEAICNDNWIGRSQLYGWRDRFEAQKDQYMGILESCRHSAVDALAWLRGAADYVLDFAKKFLWKTGMMPMQVHANPPNTCRPVFS